MLLPDMVSAVALFPARGAVPDDERALVRDAVKNKDVAVTGGYEGNGAVTTEAGLAHQALGPAERGCPGRC
jgi:hypothetical protein